MISQSGPLPLHDSEHPFATYVRILGKGKTGSRALSEEEAFSAMSMIMRGEVEDIQLGAFLMLLRVKEETHSELVGFVKAVRASIAQPNQAIAVDLDWSSYAGKKRQLPWYLLSAFLLANQGIRIVMHGAAGHTMGRIYSEDALTQLGIGHATNWSDVSDKLDRHCFAFIPLQTFCPILQRMIDFRNYLGLRSPVHTLSRLLNPLSAPYSIQSIFHPAYAHSHQLAAAELGQPNAAVFKGEGGEVERKPEATTLVKSVNAGQLSEETWPRLLEGRQQQPDLLNIDDMKAIWSGEKVDTYAQAAITGTAAIALRLLNRADSIERAQQLAQVYWQDRNRSQFLSH